VFANHTVQALLLYLLNPKFSTVKRQEWHNNFTFVPPDPIYRVFPWTHWGTPRLLARPPSLDPPPGSTVKSWVRLWHNTTASITLLYGLARYRGLLELTGSLSAKLTNITCCGCQWLTLIISSEGGGQRATDRHGGVSCLYVYMNTITTTDVLDEQTVWKIEATFWERNAPVVRDFAAACLSHRISRYTWPRCDQGFIQNYC